MKKIISMFLSSIPLSLSSDGAIVDDKTTTDGMTTLTRSFVSKDGALKRSLTICVPESFLEDEKPDETIDTEKDRKAAIDKLLDLFNEFELKEREAATKADYNTALEFKLKKERVKIEISKLKNPSTETSN